MSNTWRIVRKTLEPLQPWRVTTGKHQTIPKTALSEFISVATNQKQPWSNRKKAFEPQHWQQCGTAA
jgi:hypothetical protein